MWGWATARPGPQRVAENIAQMAGGSWSPRFWDSVFELLYKNAILPITPIYLIDKRGSPTNLGCVLKASLISLCLHLAQAENPKAPGGSQFGNHLSRQWTQAVMAIRVVRDPEQGSPVPQVPFFQVPGCSSHECIALSNPGEE